MYIHTYTCIYIYIYIYTHIFTYMYIHIYLCIYVYINSHIRLGGFLERGNRGSGGDGCWGCSVIWPLPYPASNLTGGAWVILQHIATQCNILQHTATRLGTRFYITSPVRSLSSHRRRAGNAATHRNTLQHAATRRNTLQQTR